MQSEAETGPVMGLSLILEVCHRDIAGDAHGPQERAGTIPRWEPALRATLGSKAPSDEVEGRKTSAQW